MYVSNSFGVFDEPKYGNGERLPLTGLYVLRVRQKAPTVKRSLSLSVWSTLALKLSKLFVALPCVTKLKALPVRFGAGKYFSNLTATGSKRLAGI